MKILDMCETERPRERMLSKGASALSDTELLAILLGSGWQGESAVDMAGRLLGACGGSLSGLATTRPDNMPLIKGLGPGKSCTICAAFELGRRFFQEAPTISPIPIVSSKQVYRIMRPIMKGLDHEECWALLLNNHNYLIHKQMLTKGGDASTVIDIRQVIRLALEKKASSIILTHNHPTGNPMPSNADIAQTESLRNACSTCSLSLFDHVVICDHSYYSFAEGRSGND